MTALIGYFWLFQYPTWKENVATGMIKDPIYFQMETSTPKKGPNGLKILYPISHLLYKRRWLIETQVGNRLGKSLAIVVMWAFSNMSFTHFIIFNLASTCIPNDPKANSNFTFETSRHCLFIVILFCWIWILSDFHCKPHVSIDLCLLYKHWHWLSLPNVDGEGKRNLSDLMKNAPTIGPHVFLENQ